MPAKEATREPEHVKQYCTAKSIPAPDCAILSLKETKGLEKD